MKTLLLIPFAVAAALAAAAVLCRMAGMTPHVRDLLTAAAIAVITAEAALIPAYLSRKSDATVAAQAALGGTVLHLLLTIFLAAAVMVAKVVEPGTPFILWLTGAYWLSLAMLVWGLLGFTPARQPRTK